MNKSKVITIITMLIMSSFGLHSAVINSTEEGGSWKDESTWVGGTIPTAEDDVIINGTVITNGGSYSTSNFYANNLTIAEGGKILREGEGSGGYTILHVAGNLENNGELIDLADWLDIKIGGNLTNNSVLKPRTMTMLGSNVVLSTIQPIESSNFRINVTDGSVKTATDLKFKNCYVTSENDNYLDLGEYDLFLDADTITYDGYYGKVSTDCSLLVPLKFSNVGQLQINNSIFRGEIDGNVSISSNSYAFLGDATINGDLYISENTKFSSYRSLEKIVVNGNFYNNGVMNYDSIKTVGVEFPARSMKIYVHGDFSNTLLTGITDFYLVTEGDTKRIFGNVDGYIKLMDTEDSEDKGGKVLIDSKVEIGGKLDMYSDLEIDTTGHLKLIKMEYQFYTATGVELVNNGILDRIHMVANKWNYRNFEDQPGTFIDYELRDWEGEINSVNVTTYNNQTHPMLEGTSNRWWRVESNDDFTDLQYTLKLYYDDSQLNGQSEDEINVFRSTDKGKSWEVVSVGEYVEHNKDENYFSIGSWTNDESQLTELGDFVIGTGDATVPVESPLVINLTGREDVRLGAPNPFTVTIDNITNKRTEDYILPIDVGDEIEFMYFEFTHNNGVERVPFDSMGLKKDDTALLFLPALEPNETISFDFVVKGVAFKQSGKVLDPKAIVLGAIGKDLAQDGIEDALVEVVNDQFGFTDEEEADYYNGLGKSVQEMKQKKKTYGYAVSTLRTVLKKGAEKVSNTNPVAKVLFKIGSAVETVSKVAPTLRQRLFYWFYKETGLYGVEKSKVVGGTSKDVTMVKSWDPNEKTGPSGYGEDNYLKDAGTFTYNISFENKKEATAPAYKIEILDTLSGLFNPETVEFRSTSHSESNDWTVERNGNILRWYVEGIELPPNANPPEGEGYVSFSVKLNDGVVSGDLIENKATIVFDENAPITTNTWVNVLDGISPNTTEITAAYDKQNEVINLQLEVEDNEGGSGVGEIAYFVSVDGKPFRILGYGFEKAISFSTSSDSGEVYRFYAVTSDNVGNQESVVPEVVELDVTGPSNVEENRLQIPISVYPNPVQSYINVELYEADGVYEYELYELSGRPIKNGEIIGQSSIGISELTSGVYLLKITKDKKSKVFKLVKEN